MSLANTAQEPCNYFLLLRALFRSIGGGSHEQLYQEFLPLLSNLLQGAGMGGGGAGIGGDGAGCGKRWEARCEKSFGAECKKRWDWDSE